MIITPLRVGYKRSELTAAPHFLSIPPSSIQTIGRALLSQLDEKHLSQLNKDSIGEIDLCSQVLDTIFDVYGEETRSYDPVFGKLGFLNALSNVLPTFKRLVSMNHPFEEGISPTGITSVALEYLAHALPFLYRLNQSTRGSILILEKLQKLLC